MTEKKQYSTFFEKNDLPVYFAPWWMDTVCGSDNWNVIMDINNDGRVQGLLLYHLKHKYGLSYITMPKLTPYSGLWLNYPDGQLNHSKIAYENKVLENLIQKLPKVSFYYQQHHPKVNNWLSFMWKNYSQKTLYTYILKDLQNLDACYSNLKGSTRTDIKKAEQQFDIQEIKSYDRFKSFLQDSFRKRNKPNPYDLELLENLDTVLSKKNNRFILGAFKEEQLVAVNYIITDSESAYYIASGFDPDFKTAAPMALLLWKSIEKASARVNQFDFEGSTIQGIEHFIRSFGGELTPHFQLFNAKNKLLKLLLFNYLKL